MKPEIRPRHRLGAVASHGHGRRGSIGFTLVELMIVVAILGILATIAVPTVTLFLRRAKTSEARAQLAKMFDGTVSYFQSDRAGRGDTETLGAGGSLADGAAHRCPHPAGSPAGGEAGRTPAIDCATGPNGRCVPGVGGAGPGAYEISVWDHPVWDGLSFQMEQAHYYTYNYQAENATTGWGACRFTAQAFGNLDDDGVFSTFERSAAADQNGVNANVGLYLHLVVE